MRVIFNFNPDVPHMTEPLEQTSFLPQWKLVRSAIEHENTLKSHRVTWFLATQLFLVTGFSSIFVEAIKNNSLFMSLKVYAALFIIVFLGIYACVLAWANLNAAEKSIARLHVWWLIHCHDSEMKLSEWIYYAKYGLSQKNYPPVNGMFTSNLHMSFGESQLPKALAMFWLALLLGTTAIFFREKHKVSYLHSSLVLFLLVSIAVWAYIGAIKPWLAAPSSRTVKELEYIAKKLNLKEASNVDLHQEIKQFLRKHPLDESAASPTDRGVTTSPPPSSEPAP
jgi:hypothetical protein